MRWSHSNNLLGQPLLVPVLLVIVILAVYYPALHVGIFSIDDPGIFALFSASRPLSTILHLGNGYYYRPVLELTYYLDNLLWGMEPVTMHLENILLHCANSMLVYLLARRIYSNYETPIFSLLAALLFALHPVNVETVTWIAGRTDPLITLFVLSATYFWMRWLYKPRWQDMTASILMFVTALLTKETALAFGAVVLLLTVAWPGSASGRDRLKAVGVVILPAAVMVIISLLFRSNTSALSRFLSSTDFQFTNIVGQVLISVGFYAKKLIVPYPLNFAITDVHPMYALLGLALFPFLWWIFRHYRLSGVLFISAVLIIMPATLIAVKQVAWTPFAERYLYQSTAFVALGMAGICEAWQRKYPVLIPSVIVLVLCGFAISNFQRNLLWKDSLSFFQDAVVKSPEFGSVYYSLGGILMQQGEIDRAVEAFANADRLNKRDSMRYPIKSGIMGTMLAKGKYLEARVYFFKLFNEKKAAPANFLELLYIADSKMLESIGNERKVPLAMDLLETLSLLYQKKPDPFWLYQSGKISLVAGKANVAAEFFRKAYDTAPDGAHFKGAAKTYLIRLEAEK